MNLPTDKVHTPDNGYGRLIIPWFGKDRWGKRRWLGFFYATMRIEKTGNNGIHNCRITGVH